MIDDLERDTMLRPIDSQERLLEFLGPTWRAPSTVEVRLMVDCPTSVAGLGREGSMTRLTCPLLALS